MKLMILIIRQISEKGYFDFSKLGEYQKIKELEDLKIGSEYPPYTSENGIIMLNAGLNNTPFGNFSFNTPIFGSGASQDIFSSPSGCKDIGCADEEGDPFQD